MPSENVRSRVRRAIVESLWVMELPGFLKDSIAFRKQGIAADMVDPAIVVTKGPITRLRSPAGMRLRTIDALVSVYWKIDGSGLPTGAPWNDGVDTFLKVSFRSGEDDQAIDPIIAARFPSESIEFRQRGVCTCVIEMKFGTDAEHHAELWGAAGIPDVKFRVRGRKVYDPRDLSQDADDPTTWLWSDNASLIEADWLRHELGFSVPSVEIDWDTVIESADIDDERFNGFMVRHRRSGRSV